LVRDELQNGEVWVKIVRGKKSGQLEEVSMIRGFGACMNMRPNPAKMTQKEGSST